MAFTLVSSLYFSSLNDQISSSSRFHPIAESIADRFQYCCRPVLVCFPVSVPVCLLAGFQFCLPVGFSSILLTSRFRFCFACRPVSDFAFQPDSSFPIFKFAYFQVFLPAGFQLAYQPVSVLLLADSNLVPITNQFLIIANRFWELSHIIPFSQSGQSALSTNEKWLISMCLYSQGLKFPIYVG